MEQIDDADRANHAGSRTRHAASVRTGPAAFVGGCALAAPLPIVINGIPAAISLAAAVGLLTIR